MKRIISALLIAVSLAAAGCGPTVPPEDNSGNASAGAGQLVDLSVHPAFLALATACQGGTPPSYTYSGTSVTGYLASRDGGVTSNGLFTAPICASTLIGTTVTVSASCTDKNGGPHTASVSIAISDELVNGLSIVAADVSAPACGIPTCRAASATSIKLPACTTAPTVQYYVQIGTTCGNSYYSPSNPNPTSLPTCPATVSP